MSVVHAAGLVSAAPFSRRKANCVASAFRRAASSSRRKWLFCSGRWLRIVFVGSAAVASPGPLAADQEGEAFNPFSGQILRLTKEVEIGATVAGESELTNPRAVLVDSHHVYILDPAAYGVHRFDLAGTWLNTIGGEGDGPGEFRRPFAMGWVSDTLWVADRGLARLSFFDSSARFLRSAGYRLIYGTATVIPGAALSGGGIVSVPYIPTSATSEVDSLPVVLFDEDGNQQDTLAWRAVGMEAVFITTSAPNGDSGPRTMSIGHHFDRRSLMAYEPMSRSIYVGTWRTGADATDHLELLQISATGDTVAAVRLPFGRSSLPREEVRSFARGLHGGMPESFRSRVSTGALARAFLQQIPRPSVTAVDAMTASDAGTVWFRAGARTPNGSERWTAYRPDDGFIGFVELPPDHALLAATGGMLWTMVHDEFDLPTIAGWRPAWPSGPDRRD